MLMERREQILQAAQRVYAREGFHQGTIKKIAQEAELKSPALIYWYFKDKKELFQAVLKQFSPLLHRLPDLVLQMDSPPRDVLSLVAQTYLKTFDNPKARQLLRISIAEMSQRGRVVSQLGESLLLVLNFIVTYLQRQVELGRLRPHDSQSAARSFMGTLLAYVLSREFVPALRRNLPHREQYVQEMVNIFLSGLLPEKEATKL